ncbi:MAG: acetylornithine deacetylase ArgE [Osedax symbiont Rs1]|nr:MAG: acetylornithine deacetylase ArgE [Osedax symbiont Rs1]
MAQPLSLQILQRLIAFDTTSCHSNLQLMAYVQEYLLAQGVTSELIYDEQGGKANLHATIGSSDKPGIMLSGHTDTVPVSGQNWHTDPFQLTEKEGLYYGRGTCDMKGFIAVVLAAVPQLVAQPLKIPVHLAFSYDEEIGCIGVRRLIDTLKQHPIKPAICIIGEPTSMKVVTAHKGKVAVRVTVHGKECHSGMAPQGVNAVNFAARLIVWLEQLAMQKCQQGPFDYSYEVPYSTVHVGTVKGGTALNIVPKLASFDFEIRNIGAEDSAPLIAEFKAYADSLCTQMQAQHKNCSINIEQLTEYPGLSTTEDTQAIEFVRKLAANSEIASISFGTEGGLFSNALGVATVVCGPGSMEQGHKPDEFIAIKQIEQCEAFMTRLVDELR